MALQPAHVADDARRRALRLGHPRDSSNSVAHRQPGAVAIDLRHAIARRGRWRTCRRTRSSRHSGRWNGRATRRCGPCAAAIVAVRPQHARDLEHASRRRWRCRRRRRPSCRRWPCSSTNFSGSTVPLISTTGSFGTNQPSSISVTIVTRLAALRASSISAWPSGLLTATTGMPGLRGRSSRSGVPQMDRADAPVDVYAGIDGDDADRTLLLELAHLLWERETFGDHDLAADALLGTRGSDPGSWRTSVPTDFE